MYQKYILMSNSLLKWLAKTAWRAIFTRSCRRRVNSRATVALKRHPHRHRHQRSQPIIVIVAEVAVAVTMIETATTCYETAKFSIRAQSQQLVRWCRMRREACRQQQQQRHPTLAWRIVTFTTARRKWRRLMSSSSRCNSSSKTTTLNNDRHIWLDRLIFILSNRNDLIYTSDESNFYMNELFFANDLENVV